MGKMAAAGGNPAAAGLLDDFEKALAELRKDHENLKSQNALEHQQFRDLLNGKCSKEELDDLERRMMQRLQDLIDQLKNMIPDKEALKKQLTALQKRVSNASSYAYILISDSSADRICNLRRILFVNLDPGARGMARVHAREET